MSLVTKLLYKAFETGYIPTRITKLYMKYLCYNANKTASFGDVDAKNSVFRQVKDSMLSGRKLQNRFYNEGDSTDIPLNFYEFFMGKYKNFACAYFSTGSEDLDDAEDTALWDVSEKARVRDGMNVLVIGCENGSLPFYLAQHFENLTITALSDSAKMVSHLIKKAEELKLNNINFVNKEFYELKPENKFDRIICIERFDLIGDIPGWETKVKALMAQNALFFLQAQVHSNCANFPDSIGLEDFPGNNLIQDLIVPSFKNLMLTNKALHLNDCWEISGLQYKRTADKWFRKFEFNRQPIMKALEKAYGVQNARKWYERWRLYLLSQYEKFGSNNGQNWVIGQYLYS